MSGIFAVCDGFKWEGIFNIYIFCDENEALTKARDLKMDGLKSQPDDYFVFIMSGKQGFALDRVGYITDNLEFERGKFPKGF